MMPRPRRSLRAAATISAGDFSFDGVFTMSRAQVTASPTVAPRATASRSAAPPSPTTATFFNRVGFASPL